jgi:glutathione-regulated potassium-efflux system ancillary protein KefG
VSTRRVVVLFFHPALERSRVNRVLGDAARDVPGITFWDLYERYPDFDVDVAAEQALLASHDRVVFHHPLYWYSAPPLLKQWQDLVLQHGWAYGSAGRALEGKWALHVTTTGGSAGAYAPGGHNRYTIPEFFRGFEQTAALCRMTWLPPYVAHGTHRMTPDDTRQHAAAYRRLLSALRDDQVDLAAAGRLACLSDDLDSALARAATEGR